MSNPPNRKKIIPKSGDGKKMMRVSSAARFLKVDRGTIYNMIEDGRLEMKSFAGVKFVVIE